MSQVRLSVRVGDNENKDYKRVVQVDLGSIDYLIIKDCMNTCSDEEYDRSWNRLVNRIENNYYDEIPSEWFIDKIESYEYID
jgi:hypothetical protein